MGEDKHMRTHQSLSISTIESTKKGCFLNSFVAHLTVCLHARHLYEHGHLHSYGYKREKNITVKNQDCLEDQTPPAIQLANIIYLVVLISSTIIYLNH